MPRSWCTNLAMHCVCFNRQLCLSLTCVSSRMLCHPPPILSWESELLTARVVQLVHKLEFISGPVTLKAFVPLIFIGVLR